MADDPDVLTVKEVCDLFQIHPSTLYKMVRQGKIPAFRTGSDWRLGKDAIMRWMVEKSMRSSQSRKATLSGRNGQTAGYRRSRG